MPHAAVPTALGTADRHHKSNNITLVADIRRSVLYQSALLILTGCRARGTLPGCVRQGAVASAGTSRGTVTAETHREHRRIAVGACRSGNPPQRPPRHASQSASAGEIMRHSSRGREDAQSSSATGRWCASCSGDPIRSAQRSPREYCSSKPNRSRMDVAVETALCNRFLAGAAALQICPRRCRAIALRTALLIDERSRAEPARPKGNGSRRTCTQNEYVLVREMRVNGGRT